MQGVHLYLCKRNVICYYKKVNDFAKCQAARNEVTQERVNG